MEWDHHSSNYSYGLARSKVGPLRNATREEVKEEEEVLEGGKVG